MTRKQALAVVTAAIAEDTDEGRKLATRVFIENRISRAAYEGAVAIGHAVAAKRARGVSDYSKV